MSVPLLPLTFGEFSILQSLALGTQLNAVEVSKRSLELLLASGDVVIEDGYVAVTPQGGRRLHKATTTALTTALKCSKEADGSISITSGGGEELPDVEDHN